MPRTLTTPLFSESFNNAYSGVVSSDVGVNIVSSDSDGGPDYHAFSIYAFNATAGTTLTVSYNISGVIDPIWGAPSYGISLVYYPQGYYQEPDVNQTYASSEALGVGSSGTVIFTTPTDGDYGIWIGSSGGSGGGLPTETSEAIGTFNFSAPYAVPEPASLVMLGMGAVGVLGYSRINRQRSTKGA